jgi:hypothetical protein
MDKNDRDEKLTNIREQIEKLDQVDLEALSDEDLESVSGGCSVWCCSTDTGEVADEEQPIDGTTME